MRYLSIDFETWASAPISLGSYYYLTHSDTRVLMMAFAFSDALEDVNIWWPGTPLPKTIADHIANGGLVAGWNAMSFERIAWREICERQHGFPHCPDEQWIDTMYLAVAANMPRALEAAAKFVGAPYQKDEEGHKLMLRLTSAKKTSDPSKIKPEELERFAEYCKQDVRTEMAVAMRLPAFPQAPPWPALPQVDRAINDRGILIDVALVQAMQKAAVEETARMDADMNLLTAFQYPKDITRAELDKFMKNNAACSCSVSGVVPKVTNIEKLKDWLLANDVKLKPKDAPVDEENDAPSDDEYDVDDSKIAYRLRKNDIIDLLAEDDIPEYCRLALEMRLEAAKASARKLKKMLEVVAPDGRIRWQLKLFGAQQSGRWSGASTQPHNFVRDCIGSDDHTEKVFAQRHARKPTKVDKDAMDELSEEIVSAAVADALTGNPEYIRMMQGPVLPFISKMSRRTLCAPEGQTLLQGDFSAIEARMIDWFCQSRKMLSAYKNGEDVYKILASGMMGKRIEDITKEERQRGKISKLALGFTGGAGALVAMGMQMGMKMTKSQAKPIVKDFKESNPELTQFGRDIFMCAVNAVRNKGKIIEVPPLRVLSFIYDGRSLHMNLPSGRQIHYHSPRLEGEDDYGNPVLTCLNIKGKLVFRRKLWSGILCENCSSGASVDLLAGALVRIESMGLPIVLHVHDSIAAQVPDYTARQMLPAFKAAMIEAPGWSKKGISLPIDASCHVSPRFG